MAVRRKHLQIKSSEIGTDDERAALVKVPQNLDRPGEPRLHVVDRFALALFFKVTEAQPVYALRPPR